MDSLQGSEAVIRESPDRPPDSLPRATWLVWSAALRRRHLDDFVAWLLEAGRPLALVSAQLLYISGPFLGSGARQLAQLLESESETANFVNFLAQEKRVDPGAWGRGS